LFKDIKFYFNTQGVTTSIFNLGLYSLILYRFGNKMYNKRIYKFLLLWPLYLILKNVLLILSKIELPPSAIIGNNFNLVHAYGLVMGDKVIIGNNVTVGPWVVIGHNGNKHEQPVIKDNIYIGAHACIIGKVIIGGNSIIGVNSIVNQSVGDNQIVKAAESKYLWRKA
jgi:serine acetyltransferase